MRGQKPLNEPDTGGGALVTDQYHLRERWVQVAPQMPHDPLAYAGGTESSNCEAVPCNDIDGAGV